MDAVFQMLVSNAILATIIAVVVVIVSKIWRHPPLIHMLWLLVILKMVTPPFIAIPAIGILQNSANTQLMPSTDIESVSERRSPTRVSGANSDLPANESLRHLPASVLDTPWLSQQSSESKSERHRERPVDANLHVSYVSSNWRFYLLGVWLAGAFMYTIVVCYRILRFMRLLHKAKRATQPIVKMADRLCRSSGLKGRPRIVTLDGRIAPAIWPLSRTVTIILPEELFQRLPIDSQESILAHELAHIRRKDHWIRPVEILATSLFWWHPVLWWARRELLEMEEQSCDGEVLLALPNAAKSYAAALVDTVEFLSMNQMPLPGAATGFGTTSSLKRRVTMVMQNRCIPHRRPAHFVAVGILALATLPFALVRAGNDEPSREREANLRPRELGENQINQPDKADVVQLIRKAVGRRVAMKRTCEFSYRAVHKWWYDDAKTNLHGLDSTMERQGRISFDEDTFRVSTEMKSTSNRPARFGAGSSPAQAAVDEQRGPFEQILTKKWLITLDRDQLRVADPSGDSRRNRFDPWMMMMPHVSALERVAFKAVTYEGRKCYQLEEVLPRVATRRVQIFDPEKRFVLLRKEIYYENSTRPQRAKLRDDYPFMVTTVDYQMNQDTRVWLPARINEQTFKVGSPTDEFERKLMTEVVTEFSGYSFTKPMKRRFLLYDIPLSDVERLRDDREGNSREYRNLPHPGNFLDPTSSPNMGDIPSDIAAEWFPPTTKQER